MKMRKFVQSSRLFIFNMGSRNNLDPNSKINLIKDKERGLSHRNLKDIFEVSIGAVTNILKRKQEYT